jgi:hypothetical protein
MSNPSVHENEDGKHSLLKGSVGYGHSTRLKFHRDPEQKINTGLNEIVIMISTSTIPH